MGAAVMHGVLNVQCSGLHCGECRIPSCSRVSFSNIHRRRMYRSTMGSATQDRCRWVYVYYSASFYSWLHFCQL